MLKHIPSQSTMIELLGQSLFKIWQEFENNRSCLNLSFLCIKREAVSSPKKYNDDWKGVKKWNG